MKRSHGFYSKRSRHLTTRKKGITQLLAEFPVGSSVRIRIDARGKPVPLRFNGRTGRIIARQGKAYVVEFRDLNAVKKMVLSSGHLELVGE